jgi:hypothetical protein
MNRGQQWFVLAISLWVLPTSKLSTDVRLVAASFLLQIWQTNAFKLACSTAFTLFWAGRDFAPKALIDGKNIQDWLQEHYLGAFGALYVRSAPLTLRLLPSLCFTDNITSV